MVTDAASVGATSAEAVPLSQGLLLLGAVVVLVAAYIALCSGLRIVDLFPGFFFLYHWGSIEQARMTALARVIPGAVSGLALGWLLQLTGGSLTGAIAFVLLLLPIILCQIVGRFGQVINVTTMLFLTFSTISHVQAHASFPGMFASLAIGIALFVPVVALAGRVARGGPDERKVIRAGLDRTMSD